MANFYKEKKLSVRRKCCFEIDVGAPLFLAAVLEMKILYGRLKLTKRGKYSKLSLSLKFFN